MISLVFLIPIYVGFALAVYSHYYLHLVADGSESTRRAIFWPLYAVRWLVVNLILAIRGL